MPEDIEIDYSLYQYVGRTKNNLYCFREKGKPHSVEPYNEQFYRDWLRHQPLEPVIDAEACYMTCENDLAGIKKAVQRILDGHSREGQKEVVEIMQRIGGRKV